MSSRSIDLCFLNLCLSEKYFTLHSIVSKVSSAHGVELFNQEELAIDEYFTITSVFRPLYKSLEARIARYELGN